MNVSQIMCKMIAYSQGNHHDINHLMKVYAYARTIGVCEGVSRREQEIIEIAAILHDIACPLLQRKIRKYQRKIPGEGGDWFWRGSFWRTVACRRIWRNALSILVGHHHTLTDVDGMITRFSSRRIIW